MAEVCFVWSQKVHCYSTELYFLFLDSHCPCTSKPGCVTYVTQTDVLATCYPVRSEVWTVWESQNTPSSHLCNLKLHIQNCYINYLSNDCDLQLSVFWFKPLFSAKKVQIKPTANYLLSI